MSEFNIKDLVVVNPELFTDEDLTSVHTDQFYPGLYKHFVFEVEETKSYNGKNYLGCNITNIDICLDLIEGLKRTEVKGLLWIREDHAVQASSKAHVDFIIKEPQTRDSILKTLMEERTKMKKAGLSKSNAKMIENWKQIRMARGELKGFKLPDVEVIIPKSKMKFTMEESDLPKKGDEKSEQTFQRKLRSLIKKERSSRKSISIESQEVKGGKLTKVGGVHTKAREVEKVFEIFLKNAFKIEKKPIDKKAKYIGLELELIYSGNYELLEQLMMKERLHNEVTIHRDDSVRPCHNTGYTGLEITVLVKEENLERVCTKLQSIFENPEIDAYANRSCGLHVHMDMRNRDHKSAFKNLVRVQDVLRGSQPRGRINNIHCKPNAFDEFKIINDRGDRFDRYFVINPNAYEKFNTLEVRVHEGTICSENIINWVRFLVSVADHKGEIPVGKYRLAREILELGVSIPKESIDYIDSRVSKFKSVV